MRTLALRDGEPGAAWREEIEERIDRNDDGKVDSPERERAQAARAKVRQARNEAEPAKGKEPASRPAAKPANPER